MSDSRKGLVDFQEPTERPSIAFAKELLENWKSGNEPSAGAPKNILNEYEDSGYAPGLSEIYDWVSRETEVMREAMDADILTPFALGKDFDQKLSTANDAIGRDKVDDSEMVQILADLFSCLDRSPFWRGMPLGDYWHAANAQSAQLLIGEKTCMIIDVIYDLVSSLLREQGRWAEGLLSGDIGKINFDELTKEREQFSERVKKATSALSEIAELAAKVGFLYRDSWWLDTHGDAALKGYIAKETSTKAGAGGSKASKTAQTARIKCFLKVHAAMVRDNRILAGDPPEDVAHRALKLARKGHPTVIGQVASRKVALEYWEYIKSDTKLWAEYQEILLKNNKIR